MVQVVFLLLIPFLATFLGGLMKDLGADLSSLLSSVKSNMFYTSICRTVPNISKPNLEKSPNKFFLHQKPTNIFDVQAILQRIPSQQTKTGVFENPGIADEIFIPTEISYFHGRTSKKLCLGGDFNPFEKY